LICVGIHFAETGSNLVKLDKNIFARDGKSFVSRSVVEVFLSTRDAHTLNLTGDEVRVRVSEQRLQVEANRLIPAKKPPGHRVAV
jgi:hypothetical protein